MNTKSLTPVEIDTHLAKALDTQAGYQMKIKAFQNEIARDKNALIEKSYRSYGAADRIEMAEEALEILESHLNETDELIFALNREFAVRGGWNRFFIVKNSNGHVHNSTRCGSCYVTTQFGWLYEQADKTEAEIIELAGEGACSFCFPGAPVTKRPNQLQLPEVAAAKAERAAKKEAAAAKKAATGITNPDGTLLRGRSNWIIASERTAQIEAVDAIASVRLYGYQPQPELVERIVAALAHKRGESFETTMALIQAKADKKK